MFSEFDHLWNSDTGPRPQEEPILPMDDPLFRYQKSANRAGATKIFRDALVEDVVGDLPTPGRSNLESESLRKLEKFTRVAELANSANDHMVNLMLKAGGKAGQRLQSMMRKLPVSLSEAMYRMVNNFEEFFTAEERKLLQKQIQSLDLPGFLEMFNDRVINARLG